MSKDEYIKILKKNIKRLDKTEKNDVLNEYETHFLNGYKDNKSDDEISNNLGNPFFIAKEINALNDIERVENEKGIKNFIHAIFSVMGLSIVNFIIILSSIFIFFLLLPIILACIIAIPVMLFSPIILIILSFTNGFSVFNLENIFEAIKGIMLGLFLAILGYFIVKIFFKLIISFLKWNISIVRRENIVWKKDIYL